MKLVSLNMEKDRHLKRVEPFLIRENADVVCLLEAPERFATFLESQGYITAFAPMRKRTRESITQTYGVLAASKSPTNFRIEYYHGAADKIIEYDRKRKAETESHPVIIMTISDHDQKGFTIATTHMAVTAHGREDKHQIHCTTSLLKILESCPPHVLCGDMNIPRGYNALYKKLITRYTDAIPISYSSSLDRDLHRLGNKADLDDPIFDSYMVDYIFTQEPYQAENIRLQFGVSDHAAVIGTIERKST